MEVVLHMCVQALSFMRFSHGSVNAGAENTTCVSMEFLSSVFLPKTDPESQSLVDLANENYPADNNRVCNHFREKNDRSRILCPVWDTATDNLAVVPISIDFMSNGLGIPEATVVSFKTIMAANDSVYFVLTMGKMNGQHCVAGGSSFIVVP